ncbi:MAG: ATP-dependent metallopeptidase FtsH/Yme1/Tma family protein [Candidatus Hydrogenedentes bacterium]|nr:ATP-dependent metallopeptidase FtsH/Yme1/Tma family protein [Candidatus Hydrogenedentota bacterium]
MNGVMKQISLWLVLLIIVVLALSQFQSMNTTKKDLGEQDFVAQVDANNIEGPVQVSELGQNMVRIRAKFKNQVDEHRTIDFNTNEFKEEWKKTLDANQVSYKFAPESTLLGSLLINIFPLLLIFGVFYFLLFRQMQGGSNKAMSFGKSRAKMVNQSEKSATFKDVAGVDEAKEELQEIIEFLKDPKRFTRLGGKIPRGVLLVGPPGSGKTLLARAVAGEANVPFFSISGSDFVEMFVGVGASRVRDLFQQGHKHAPCIIFIDEIDAVGRQRGAGMGGGHDEREQTLNQLLVEMDGFNTNDGVILMAATNRPDVLDRALLRPGRFDRQIVVPNPDITGRKAILDIHIRNQKVPLGKAVDTGILSRGTPGFSGADLANMVNEAALLAARRNQDDVTMVDFEDAKDRVLMGPARRSLVMNAEEKLATAYHEAGHTLVGQLLPDADPVHKVTIIPRGPTLGVTSMLPTEDRHSISKKHCLATIRVLMGGRAAEDIIFGQFTSGASNDLKVATQRAHAMVCEWGMSDLGPISFGGQNEIFLGRDFTKTREYSDETASAVDREIHKILEQAYKDAKEMLQEHEPMLRVLSEELYEKETLDAYDIDAIIRREGGDELLTHRTRPQRPAPAIAPPPIPAPPSKKKEESSSHELPPGSVVPDTA